MSEYLNERAGCELATRPDEETIHRYVSLPLGVRNPAASHPVLLCWDNSGSTAGNGAIDEENHAQDQLAKELKIQRSIAPSVLVATAGFGTAKPFELMTPFAPSDKLVLPKLVANTSTPHCQRVEMAVDFMITARRILSQEFEREVRTAWIFDFCDGAADDNQHVARAIKASHETALREQIHVFFFGVGRDCNFPYLEQLAQPGRPAVLMKKVESFRRFFEWLTQSLNIYQCSRPGDRVELPPFEDGPRLITEG